MTFEHKVKHGRNAVGGLINFMKDVGLDAEQIVDMLKAEEEGKYPKGLEPARYDVDELLEAKRYGFYTNHRKLNYRLKWMIL